MRVPFAFLATGGGAAPAPTVSSVTPDHGPESTATAIVVEGTDFVTGCTVTINGFDCTSVTFIDSTEVHCDTPSSMFAGGPYNLTLTNPDTQSDTLVNAYTFDAGAVPVVVGVSLDQIDIAGGGQRVVVEVDDSTGCTAITAAGVAFTSFAVDDGTHVSGIPGAHAAGTGLDIVVTNATGDSTTGTGLIEYWAPAQITGISAYLDADKGVTDAGAGAVSQWDDQSANARSFLQGTGANRPVQTAAVFGTLPSIRLTPQQWVKLASAVDLSANGTSVFAVAKWTSADASASGSDGAPLTILGDGTNAYGGFGASADAIQSIHYVGGYVYVTRGSGLNDGTARLIGATYPAAGDVKIYVGTTQQGTTASSGPIAGANTYDTIGAAYGGVDGWDGDLGAVIIVDGVISGSDLTKLNKWAKQRFGTP